MARHYHRTGSGASQRALDQASCQAATHRRTKTQPGDIVLSPDEIARADALDQLAAKDIEVIERPRAVRKFNCYKCYINVGPGYHEQEIWYQFSTDQWICGRCADNQNPADVDKLISETEITDLRIGEIHKLCVARIKAIHEDRGQYD